jgi:hypothetical protein
MLAVKFVIQLKGILLLLAASPTLLHRFTRLPNFSLACLTLLLTMTPVALRGTGMSALPHTTSLLLLLAFQNRLALVVLLASLATLLTLN